MKKTVVILLSILVLAATGCVSKGKYDNEVQLYDQKSQEAAALAAQNKAYQELNQKLQAEIKADEVQIQQLKDRLKVTMVNEILFHEGGWQLDKKGKIVLDKIVPALKDIKDHRIAVLGYTDNVPIGHELKKRFPSNWELSTARATEVVRYLEHKGIKSELLSATGFGEKHPVASNDTKEGRHKNRRVEIDITAMNR